MGNQITRYESGRLSESALAILEISSTATDTEKQYRSHFRIFERWLAHNNLSLPVTHLELINFIADQFYGRLVTYDQERGILLDGQPIASSTIDARRWGILKVLASKGVRFTSEQRESISQYIARIKLISNQQASERKRGQAAPLRWPLVEKMMVCDRITNQSNFKRLRDRALLAFMAVSGCRESEAVGETGVRLKDFFIYDDRINYQRNIRKLGHRDYGHRGSIARGTDSESSPYQAIKAYCDYVKKLPNVTPTTKLFIRAKRNGQPFKVKEGDYAALGQSKIDEYLRDWAYSSGMPLEFVECVSGHSLRIGLAVDQVEQGHSYEYISQITGQTRDTVERYAKQAQMSPFNIAERSS